MYADRVEAGGKRSIRDRLNGNTVEVSARRQITGKRQRSDDDDKWEHDLYKDNEPQVSNRNVGSKDLRLKLQRKANQGANGSHSGTRDLREKLSGVTYQQTVKDDIQKPKTVVPQVKKPAQKGVIVENPEPETKRVASTAQKKKSYQKTESVDSFLQSLGLEKYSIAFLAEEVDMTALMHMTDADLKAVGVPMGPRKKILSALESKG
ncbi:ankyrin repeat and SAM domain-containing protein 6 [Impatiens glandulifera]|uniref:ankyrin repeat and SAM domain-containing protein 6 n=1 Tax=Impatiens glandulifera TaxID=253017 RepID=UPI001FB11EB7|nr:ankyrin repeat and SAM domain-containing protein 6 [Impatiens glandulifera]